MSRFTALLRTIFGGLLLSSCSTLVATPAVVTHAPPISSEQTEETIWVLDSGWHTGLIVETSELGSHLNALLSTQPRSHYLMFGWGNRKFYMTPNPTLGMDVAALFPSESTLLVEGCNREPRACYSSAVKLRAIQVSLAGQRRLDNYLLETLKLNAIGQAEVLGAGPDPGSEFYASGLTYDAFHTCNTWTAQALHTAGIAIDWHGVIFADQLWSQLNRSPAQTAAGRAQQ